MTVEDFITRFAAGLAALEDLPLRQARPCYDALCAGFAPTAAGQGRVAVHRTRLAGVPVRRVQPPAPALGQVLFFHGGGFTLGSSLSHLGVAVSLAAALGREVVSVDYRLAPEAGYPEMLADCRGVAEALDTPLALVGDSAGGRLVLDLAAGQAGPPPLGLVYPPVDGIDAATLGPDAPLLSRDDVLSLRRLCPAALPLEVASAPPATQLEVLAVEHDPLTAPLEAAVARWRNAGASVGYRRAPGMVHGALHAHASLTPMKSAWQDFCQALMRRIAGHQAGPTGPLHRSQS